MQHQKAAMLHQEAAMLHQEAAMLHEEAVMLNQEPAILTGLFRTRTCRYFFSFGAGLSETTITHPSAVAPVPS